MEQLKYHYALINVGSIKEHFREVKKYFWNYVKPFGLGCIL